jgi:hypothetical protein
VKSAPILFIHYGASPYLYYTLRCAKKFNPDKSVILLGDKYNRLIGKMCGVEFYDINDFAGSEELKQFDKNYRFIAGEKHGRQVWTNFVFRRWFILHQFLRATNTECFWTFDSDTLVLTGLSEKENYFQSVDSTEQCGGRCLNGYIKNFSVVDGYIHSMLATLSDEKQMEAIRNEIKQNPSYAFTEMKAYEIYKAGHSFQSAYLVRIRKDETFDDCICYRDGMELSNHKTGANYPKRVFTNGQHIFFKDAETGNYIRANTINMSWVPDSYVEKIYAAAITCLENGKKQKPATTIREIRLHETSMQYYMDSVLFTGIKISNKIKRAIRKDEVIR